MFTCFNRMLNGSGLVVKFILTIPLSIYFWILSKGKTAFRFSLISLLVFLGAAVASSMSSAHHAARYNIGVYYYPGWSPGVNGPQNPDPWAPIQKYPEREPALGWYRDGDPDVVNTQLGWMHEYGINFVAFDWYWHYGKPQQEQSLLAYFGSPNRKYIKFSLLWANHWPNADINDFDAMVAYWITNYFNKPEMMTIDGKPVVFIFSPDDFSKQAQGWGRSPNDLLQRARSAAQAAGLKGIYFAMGTPALEFWVKGAPQAGFDALSAYNYHFSYSGSPESASKASHSYNELDQIYQTTWDWILQNSSLPYILPVTTGWDHRPWGASSDPLHDQSVGSADEFSAHLRAAKNRVDKYPVKTQRTVIVCCWNEYGEGSILEPTKKDGFEYLKRLRKVFTAKH